MPVMHIGVESAAWGAQTWAAFLQAILSAAAIFAAWCLQRHKHRREVIQRSAVLVDLLRQLAEISRDADEYASAAFGNTHVVELDVALLKTLRDAVESLPVHEIPLASMCKAIVIARREARMLEENVREITGRQKAGLDLQETHAMAVAENRGRLVLAHAEAIAVHKEFVAGRERDVEVR